MKLFRKEATLANRDCLDVGFELTRDSAWTQLSP